MAARLHLLRRPARLPLLPRAVAAVTPSGASCPGTQPPPLTADELRGVVLAEASPNATTVGSTFNQCSFGKTKLTANNSLVTDVVELPCSGTT